MNIEKSCLGGRLFKNIREGSILLPKFYIPAECLKPAVFIQIPSCWYSNESSEYADLKNNAINVSRMPYFQEIVLFVNNRDNAIIHFLTFNLE